MSVVVSPEVSSTSDGVVRYFFIAMTTTEKEKKADRLDYSKWDNLHVSSDDEEDCHPNIDIKLWKRLQGEKFRKERQEQDDRIEVLDKLIAREIEKPRPDEEKLKKWRKELTYLKKLKSRNQIHFRDVALGEQSHIKIPN